MVGFANKHDAKVIAEGVETAEEYETVKQLGVHLVQGFYLHPPSSNGTATPVPPAPVAPA
jgi:EAL domain-containing protein (putative c-di-GMP-specific phosphodiesterase class I)